MIKSGSNLKKHNKQGRGVLHYAVDGFPDCVEELVKHGAPVNIGDVDGDTPLMLAARSSGLVCLSPIEDVLKHINAHDGDKHLILVTNSVPTEMAEILLKAGAKVNQQNKKGETALHLAAAARNPRTMRVLLQHGADRSIRDRKEETPGDRAIRLGYYEAAAMLAAGVSNIQKTIKP